MGYEVLTKNGEVASADDVVVEKSEVKTVTDTESIRYGQLKATIAELEALLASVPTKADEDIAAIQAKRDTDLAQIQGKLSALKKTKTDIDPLVDKVILAADQPVAEK